MILALPLLALFLTPSASAGRLIFEKKSLFAVYVWIDGEPLGKIKGKKQHNVEFADGEHEIWVAADESGTLTSCHGLFSLAGSTLVVARNDTCDGVTQGFPAQGSFYRGASVTLVTDPLMSAWISIDGATAVALPSIPIELNLKPGAHSIELFVDEGLSAVLFQGSVVLEAGDALAVTCGPETCEGWAQPTLAVDEPALDTQEPALAVDEPVPAAEDPVDEVE